MRLYRMELYKLYHNKIFRIGLFAATALLLAYFWFAEVGGEIAAVDGSVYYGYEAVKMNKKITKEFEGELTDEKYGMPSKLEENMPGWRDGNILNDFVTRYFTNGAWENGITPTERYMIAETELGENCEKLGITTYLTYTTGWKIFVEMLQFGMILGSILVICGVSTVFSEESQTKMLPLIFSTEEGRRKDVMAKIVASFTFTISVFLWFAVINLVLCQVVYGLNGFNNIAGLVLSESIRHQSVMFPKYLAVLLMLALEAFLSLCAITLCVSSHQNSSFGAVIISAACWGLPVIIRIFFGGFMTLIVDAMPVFLIMTAIVEDIYNIWQLVFAINIILAIACLAEGTIVYKSKQIA